MSKSIFQTKTTFERFGILIDNSRVAVMNVSTAKRMIDIMEKLGYNTLMLYTEDTYEVDGQPYFGHLRGRYKKTELKEMNQYAAAHGIELVPCIQTLAHLNCLMYWREYAMISDCNDILCVGEDKVYQLIEDMFVTLSECFTTRLVNIGMDEAGMVGLGRYLNKHGYRNRIEILREHLEKVSNIAKKYGFILCMWSDMFYKLATGGYHEQESGEIDLSVSAMIPDNVRLIYWDYYSTDKSHYDNWIKEHEKLKPGTMFAGGLWTWTGFVPHNRYAIETGTAATQSCLEHQVKDVFYTIWGDNGNECSRFAVLPAMFYNACIAHGIQDEVKMKQKFQECFGIAFDDYMLVDLPGTASADGNDVNPDKHMLYCDCLLGKFDLNVRKNDAKEYALVAKQLEPLMFHAEFGATFATLKALCDVLAIKFDLGVRTREAYLSGDREKVKEMLADYDAVIEKIELFYEAFRRQWLIENKPHGLDVHDTRIGGLLHRVKSCKRRLDDYVCGQIERIEELEEPVLDFRCRGEFIAEEDKHSFGHYAWGSSVTASII